MSDRLQAGLRVAIAEDEALIAMMLEDLLGALDAEVVASAATLAETMAIPLAGLDAAVIDIHLGGEESRDGVRRLQAAGVPVVLATGSGAADLDGAYAACVLLSKPYTIATLSRALSVAISTANAGVAAG